MKVEKDFIYVSKSEGKYFLWLDDKMQQPYVNSVMLQNVIDSLPDNADIKENEVEMIML